MNPDLVRLQPYPFQKLADLHRGIVPSRDHVQVNLSIGEPKHATPPFIVDALSADPRCLSSYPATVGSLALREAISAWLAARHRIPPPDPAEEVLPVNGSREALFAFAQAVVDRTRPDPVVVMPNPFYQIYEGAALLAGARPWFVNQSPDNGFACDFNAIPEPVLRTTQLVYVCSPGNPTGRIMSLEEWRRLFDLSDQYGFVIAADECYSEIHFDEGQPPLGALGAARALGRIGYPRLVVFSSLSKRSNVPGMRSGFAAGDRQVLRDFLLYRTYHGSAMSPAGQAASVAAWRDETHVRENRRLYREKFDAVIGILSGAMSVSRPDAAFYLWLPVGGDDRRFARELFARYNVSVLPGSFLAREAHGVNPGTGFVRVALVAPLAECTEAARRMADLLGRDSNNRP